MGFERPFQRELQMTAKEARAGPQVQTQSGEKDNRPLPMGLVKPTCVNPPWAYRSSGSLQFDGTPVLR
jgi:hypothetical protein